VTDGSIGSITQYDEQPAASKRGPFQQQFDPTSAGGKHLYGEHPGGGQVTVGEVATAGDQQVGLHHGVTGERHVERRQQHLQLRRTGKAQQQMELTDHGLMWQRGCGGHDERPVDDFVAVPPKTGFRRMPFVRWLRRADGIRHHVARCGRHSRA
jgi:hypothetical protein